MDNGAWEGMVLSTLKHMKGVSQADQDMIADIEAMMGPEPARMGVIKNFFWNRVLDSHLFPYPQQDPKENAACDALLEQLEHYLKTEHPSRLIDEEEQIPDWVLTKLFRLGIMGLTIPKDYGGLGFGITSYNRVLEKIGAYCGSTAVVVSAHQSIGCKAVMLFGTQTQKDTWLPKLAHSILSAFCLSEPGVGCDAGGQETTYRKAPDNAHYIISGEKKWSTSGALSGLFTVIAKDANSSHISAFICTPDMKGIDILEKNRSKCGIRGTWQARIRFNEVVVPAANLLHVEGKGLQVALSCLNYGRCTLSAGMLGAAQASKNQAIKWAQQRIQFKRPLASFELVKEKIARMSALTYAMDAMLYMTTGMLDQKHPDIMVETAACKLFNSHMGWIVINDAMQLMGGEGYMTENKVERAFRDNRIHLIVEGANEVMHAFIFAYGSKKLAEQLLHIKHLFSFQSELSLAQNIFRFLRSIGHGRLLLKAGRLALELFFKLKHRCPKLRTLTPQLKQEQAQFCRHIRDLNHHVKRLSHRHRESLLDKQVLQSRVSCIAMWLFASACVLSKLDQQAASGTLPDAAGRHALAIANLEIKQAFQNLYSNTDTSMRVAAQDALDKNSLLDNALFISPERFCKGK